MNQISFKMLIYRYLNTDILIKVDSNCARHNLLVTERTREEEIDFTESNNFIKTKVL